MLKVAGMARRAGGRARVLALSILAGASLRFIFDFVFLDSGLEVGDSRYYLQV